MKLDIGAVQTSLSAGVVLMRTLTPIAEALGGPQVATAIAIGNGLATFAESTLQSIHDGQTVAEATGIADVRRALQVILAENDKLAALVDAS